MTRLPVLLAGGILLLVASLGAQRSGRQNPPIFRGGVDLVQLDVSVLDRDRRPVRGLTADDFSVLIDGQPRPVTAFRFVDLPPPPAPPTAPWLREIAPDVVTNARPAGRVVAIVIDDGSFGAIGAADLFAVRKARETARAAVDELGPEDTAGVFFTENGRTAQSFTTDRRLLLDAIDRAALFPSPGADLRTDIVSVASEVNDPLGVNRPSCDCGTCSIEAVGRIADALRSLPQQRKIVMFVSAGVRVDPQVSEPYVAEGRAYVSRVAHCNVRKQRTMADVFRRASLANVTLQAVDVRGVLAADPAPGLAAIDVADTAGGIDLRMAFLRAMAEETGGRAVVRNNDMEREVPALIEESSAYYLLGIDTSDLPDDGRLHTVNVRVGRPDVDIRTRRGFYAPTREERRAQVNPSAAGTDAAIAAALPTADLSLGIGVAPFADASSNRGAAIAVVIGVTQPNDGRGAARRETIRVQATAFNTLTGARIGSDRHTLGVSWNATAAGNGSYEVLSKLPVPPGRYEIRAAVETDDGRTGSVYTYVDVPDFRRADLALSGLVVLATPSPRSAPPDALHGLTPSPPTTRRAFAATDTVDVFLRIYQRREGDTITVTTRITDERDEVVADLTMPIVDTVGRNPVTADHRVELPIADLAPGDYLLTVEVSDGRHTAVRDLRFSVR